MRRIVFALGVSAIATTSMFVASAAASGPAPPGKNVIEIQCAGIGAISVSTPRPETSKGVGQIIGQKGHGIPVSVTFTLTDVTKSKVLVTESERLPPGRVRSHQETTTCTATFAEVSASQFFEGHGLPPGVAPNDIIRASIEVQVIVKGR